jgi:alanyl-tRNA synthetase
VPCACDAVAAAPGRVLERRAAVATSLQSSGMRTSAELREGFLSFFEEKGHLRLPSWPLVPRPGDTSTLLTTAGMQPQMPYFLEREPPPAPLTATSQKCFRTPDIDEVGLDGHHLTFFEMLGNFSFGQYFKEGAIQLATEFVQERLRLDWERIWVTVHAGDPAFDLGPDETAIRHWQEIGMPTERIVPLPSSENFWSVGGPGPCGPDSEIYWDWGPQHGCGDPSCAPACHRCDRFLEFWNLVFMEFEQHPDGTLTPLPKQNIDTGMGVERLAAIVQDVRSVYETDGYQAIMAWVAAESGVAFGDSEAATKAHRVLADHGRGMTFLVGDGVTPSNEGRGYVLRRVIRRAVQQARTIGLPDLWRLSDVVVEQMGQWYPELVEHRQRISAVLRAEEERFGETLARGLKLFEEVAAGGAITGKDAFDLTATYGFPFELTTELARERGLLVDEDDFRARMEEHREISRSGGARTATALEGPPSTFVGYEQTETLTTILALNELGDGRFEAKLERSPFYPAGGGQVTDAGWIEHEEREARAELRDATRVGDDQVLVFEGGGFAVGDRVRAVVPWAVRFPTMANHTATHLLHEALRRVLGEHVQQAGSAVRPDKLRFDFTHDRALTPEERAQVEQLVNEQVFRNHRVRIFETPLEEARRLGAQMLFGEKYGDVVRVVEIDGFSRELCGGTHVRTTAEIGPFAILSEGSVGSGARRIEAVTSGEAFALLHARAQEAEQLRGELERLRKEAKRPAPEARAEFSITRETEQAGVHVLVVEVRTGDALDVSDRLKQQHAPAAVIVGARANGTAQLVINLDGSLEGRGLHAGTIIREAAALIGGGGGGRPTMARAGGKDAARLEEALALAERTVLDALAS